MTDTDIFTQPPRRPAISVGPGSRLLQPSMWGNEERFFLDRIRSDGRPLQIKLSGEVVDEPRYRDAFLGSAALLDREGVLLITTHGGGKQIGRNLVTAGIEARWSRDALRITDEATLEVVEQSIKETNGQLVDAFHDTGMPAFGLTDGVFEVEPIPDRPDLMLVGQTTRVNYDLVRKVTAAGQHAILGCLGRDARGQLYNQNADTAARAFATLDPYYRPSRLFAVTGVGGIKPDRDAEETYAFLDTERAQGLIEKGIVTDGMATKTREAILAAKAGVPVAVTSPAGLINEITRNEGEGTLIAEKQVVDIFKMGDVNPDELHEKVAKAFEPYQGTLRPDFLETLSDDAEIYLLQHDCGIAIVEPMENGMSYLNKVVVPERERGLGYMDTLFDVIKDRHPEGVVWRTWEGKKGLVADYMRLANMSAKLAQPNGKNLIVYGAFPDEIQDWTPRQLMAWQATVATVASIPVTVTYSELALA